MKKFLLIAFLTAALPLASMAQETCKRHGEPKGGFSYCPPEGWTIKDDPDSEYESRLGPRSDGFTPNFTVRGLKNFPVPLKEMVSIFTKQSPEEMAQQLEVSSVSEVNESEFTTDSKQAGIKLTFQSAKDGVNVRHTMYFFVGRDNEKLLVTFTALETQAKSLESVFDRSMKTWQLDPVPK